MDIVVTGIGLLSCLGNLKNTWDSLLSGKSSIKIQQPFSHIPPYPLGLIKENPIDLDLLIRLVVTEALQDASLDIPLIDCGVVVGSSRGCQRSWESFLDGSTSIVNWLESLPHRGAILTANLIGSSKPVLSPMAACATGIHAIVRGKELIETGECDRVIAGAIESPITPLTLAGFERMGALAKTGCYPFSVNREGLVLGEGGAIFVLERSELAISRGAKIYGKISGFGLTCDGSGIVAPESNNSSAILAVKQCLARSNLNTENINYIHTHGTSTKLNDLHEAKLIESLFGNNIAISSTKGSTGHTLGGSGAMGVAFCLMALQSDWLPPCVGLTEPEFNLNIIRKAQKAKIDNALCFSFGFGGQNAILAIRSIPIKNIQF